MNKFTFGLAKHLVFANAAVINEDSFSPEPVQMDPFLGYEIDFTVKYQFADEVTIEAGYSHLFDTSTMREVKGTNNQTTSNWAYLMVVVRSEEHTSELQSRPQLVCRLLLEKKK